jgi:hypothetical protein
MITSDHAITAWIVLFLFLFFVPALWVVWTLLMGRHK